MRTLELALHSIGLDLDTTDGLFRALAEVAGSLVVSFDYRRAPEVLLRAGLDECWAVLQWLSEHGGKIGGDHPASPAS